MKKNGFAQIFTPNAKKILLFLFLIVLAYFVAVIFPNHSILFKQDCSNIQCPEGVLCSLPPCPYKFNFLVAIPVLAGLYILACLIIKVLANKKGNN